MAAETLSPSLPAASIDIHEQLWLSTGWIRDTLDLARFAAAWIVSLPILFGIGLFIPWVNSIANVVLYLGGLLTVLTSVYVLWESGKAKESLEDWEDNFLPFLYSVKFEMFPYSGSDRERYIWQRYVSMYPGLAGIESPRGLAKLLRKTRFQLRGKVKGKEAEHFFDVFAYFKDDTAWFVRRFNKDEPVGKQDLTILKEEIEDVLRKISTPDAAVAAFSRSGFSDEAIEFSEDESSSISDEFGIDLIAETEKGYKVVAVG